MAARMAPTGTVINLFHFIRLAAAEAHLHQLVDLLDDPVRLLAGIHAAGHQLHEGIAHARRQLHLALDQQPGDILGRVGDGVLHPEHIEQIAPVHRHEHALGQVGAEVVFDGVGLLLLGEDLVLLQEGDRGLGCSRRGAKAAPSPGWQNGPFKKRAGRG